jgi:hypothetical protein
MAFDAKGFVTVAAAKAGNAPSVYAYKTADAITDVRVEGYFNDLAQTLKVGDLIYCVTSTGSTAVASLTVVRSNAAGVVDVDNGTVLAATDSD